MTPGAYAELVELAERELELVHSGQIDAVAAVHERRADLVASLPLVPPAAAFPLLKRAAALQRQTEAALERDMAQSASELHSVRRGRHAVQAYTPAPNGTGDIRLVDSSG